MSEIDKTIFDENLLLTQAYCELQLKNTYKNYASILRSFNPGYNGKELFSFEFSHYSNESTAENWVSTNWTTDPLENNLYAELFEKQLAHKRAILGEFVPIEYQGKILIAEIDLTVVDGASEQGSHGLVDFYDCPPIDTWFYKTKNDSSQVLFAWIPEPLVNLANRAIEVNPVDCLYWYNEARPESGDWHNENLGEMSKGVTTEDEKPQSVFEQIKKMFS